MILIFFGPAFDYFLNFLISDGSKGHNYETYIIKISFVIIKFKYIMSIDKFKDKL
jgi:hypothetical protein